MKKKGDFFEVSEAVSESESDRSSRFALFSYAKCCVENSLLMEPNVGT